MTLSQSSDRASSFSSEAGTGLRQRTAIPQCHNTYFLEDNFSQPDSKKNCKTEVSIRIFFNCKPLTSSGQEMKVLPGQRTGYGVDRFPETSWSFLLNGILQQFLQRLQQLDHVRGIGGNLCFICSKNKRSK